MILIEKPRMMLSSPSAASVSERPTVFVVDDDDEVRTGLEQLLASVRLQVETFASAQQFLDAYRAERPGCLLLDVRMPGMSGLELQAWLNERRIRIPILFLTAHAEVDMAVEAMKAGAVDFLQKPFSPQDLLEKVQRALDDDLRVRRALAGHADVAARLASLSPREREVMDLLIAGKNAKEIATQLNISPTTTDFHRRNLLEKMQVENVVQLTRQIADLRHTQDE